MIEFMKSHYYDPYVAQYVHPKKEFKVKLKDADKDFVFDETKADLNKFDKFIDEIEPDALRLPVLLKKYELYSLIQDSGGGSTEVGVDSSDYITNPPLLPIDIEFTIHGISGLKVGDIFKVVDLPNKFADKVFQITEINHEVGEQWLTKVKAGMRNI